MPVDINYNRFDLRTLTVFPPPPFNPPTLQNSVFVLLSILCSFFAQICSANISTLIKSQRNPVYIHLLTHNRNRSYIASFLPNKIIITGSCFLFQFVVVKCVLQAQHHPHQNNNKSSNTFSFVLQLFIVKIDLFVYFGIIYKSTYYYYFIGFIREWEFFLSFSVFVYLLFFCMENICLYCEVCVCCVWWCVSLNRFREGWKGKIIAE